MSITSTADGLAEATITSTGTQNDVNFLNASLLRCDNASELTITGFVAGVAGQRLTVVSVGAGAVKFAHQNASSSAANRLFNIATSAPTPLAAASGVATFAYDGTTQRWRLVEHDQGAAIRHPYSAADFTASAGTWTVEAADVVTYDYMLTGRQLLILYSFQTTSVSSTPLQLRFAIPGGFSAGAAVAACGNVAVQYYQGSWVWNGSIEFTALGYCNLYQALGATNWAVSVNGTYVKGYMVAEIL